MLSRDDIIKILKEKKQDFNIDFFVLFGSFARGTQHKNSDIDIAYILKKGKKLSFEKYLQLEEELKKIIQLPIDIMNFEKLNPLIKLHAKEDFIYVW